MDSPRDWLQPGYCVLPAPQPLAGIPEGLPHGTTRPFELVVTKSRARLPRYTSTPIQLSGQFCAL